MINAYIYYIITRIVYSELFTLLNIKNDFTASVLSLTSKFSICLTSSLTWLRILRQHSAAWVMFDFSASSSVRNQLFNFYYCTFIHLQSINIYIYTIIAMF